MFLDVLRTGTGTRRLTACQPGHGGQAHAASVGSHRICDVTLPVALVEGVAPALVLPELSSATLTLGALAEVSRHMSAPSGLSNWRALAASPCTSKATQLASCTACTATQLFARTAIQLASCTATQLSARTATQLASCTPAQLA